MIATLLTGISIQAAGEENDSTLKTTPCEEGDFKACINQYPADVVEFRIQKSSNDVVWIKIIDHKGSNIYKKRYKRHNFVELDCDIHELPEGEYNYLIQLNGDVVLKKTFSKNSI